MISAEQFALTTAYVQQHPETARREILAVCVAKARGAARRFLKEGAALADFGSVREHYEGVSLPKAIARHSRRLDAFRLGAESLYGRTSQLRDLIGDDPALLAELADVRIQMDAARHIARSVAAAWEVEKARLAREDELTRLKFSTSMEAVVPLLDALREAEAPGPPDEARADDTIAAA
jgi:hypothetical protein